MDDSHRGEEVRRESSSSGTMQLLDRLGHGLVTIPPGGFGEENGKDSGRRDLLVRSRAEAYDSPGKSLVGYP